MALLFHHERLQEYEENHKSFMARFAAQEQRFNTGRAIAELWQLENPNRSVRHDYFHEVDLYLLSTDKLSCIQPFLDEVEEDILYDWTLDPDMSHSTPSMHTYYYGNTKNNDTLYVYFHNSNCRYIETGKMIPETIQVCGES